MKVSHQDRGWTRDLTLLAQILTVRLGICGPGENQCLRLKTELTLMTSACFINILILHTFHRIPQIRIRCLSCTDIYNRGKDRSFRLQNSTTSREPYAVIASHLQRLLLTTTQWRPASEPAKCFLVSYCWINLQHTIRYWETFGRVPKKSVLYRIREGKIRIHWLYIVAVFIMLLSN